MRTPTASTKYPAEDTAHAGDTSYASSCSFDMEICHFPCKVVQYPIHKNP